MSLNKSLCKAFDKEKKGYVTIGDILKFVIIIGSIMLTGWTIIYSVYRFMISGAFWNTSPVNQVSWEVLGGTITTFGAMAIATVIIFIIHKNIEKIWGHKIAECPLKENENK